MKRNCKHCGKTFNTWPYLVRQGYGIHCSSKCYGLSLVGRKVSEEIRKKQSVAMKRIKFSPKVKFKKGNIPWHKGKKFSPQQLKSFRAAHLKSCKSKGRIKKYNGYIYVKNWDHPFRDKDGYVPEHRLIAEKFLGRFLEPKEIIHHINEIKSDNFPKNLYLFPSSSEHISHHMLARNGKIRILKSNLS